MSEAKNSLAPTFGVSPTRLKLRFADDVHRFAVVVVERQAVTSTVRRRSQAARVGILREVRILMPDVVVSRPLRRYRQHCGRREQSRAECRTPSNAAVREIAFCVQCE